MLLLCFFPRVISFYPHISSSCFALLFLSAFIIFFLFSYANLRLSLFLFMFSVPFRIHCDSLAFSLLLFLAPFCFNSNCVFFFVHIRFSSYSITMEKAKMYLYTFFLASFPYLFFYYNFSFSFDFPPISCITEDILPTFSLLFLSFFQEVILFHQFFHSRFYCSVFLLSYHAFLYFIMFIDILRNFVSVFSFLISLFISIS